MKAVPHNPRSKTVVASLDTPLPILGLRAQRLGYVYRLLLSLDTREIIQVELCTPWQTLRVDVDAIQFDDDHGAFRLVSGKRKTL